jgi:hypothetical protein
VTVGVVLLLLLTCQLNGYLCVLKKTACVCIIICSLVTGEV